MIRNIKGTKDILPNETELWQYIEKQIHAFLKKFGYAEIRTPIFEETNLFTRSIGEESDIVSKEMYSWIDQGGNKLTLKPESTASVVRAFNQHNFSNLNKINRFYYINSLFRRERPQKGRFRQFEQFGVEAIGSDSSKQDVEIISMAYYFYEFMKINDLKLKLNSIGSVETRKIYKKSLTNFLMDYKKELTDVSKRRLMINPLRILDTKVDFEKDIIKNAPKIIDYLDDNDKKHFETILNCLEKLNIKYEIDHCLVRGLDYYSRTVFEIHSSLLGSQTALCGGGRYDYLIKELGGASTPAIGFAAGIERLIIAMDKDQHDFLISPDIYIITLGEDALNSSLNIMKELRLNNNLSVISDTLGRNLKAQMKEANKLNVSYSIILGEDEIKNNKLIVKNMETGVQEEISINKISQYFK